MTISSQYLPVCNTSRVTAGKIRTKNRRPDFHVEALERILQISSSRFFLENLELESATSSVRRRFRINIRTVVCEHKDELNMRRYDHVRISGRTFSTTFLRSNGFSDLEIFEFSGFCRTSKIRSDDFSGRFSGRTSCLSN